MQSSCITVIISSKAHTHNQQVAVRMLIAKIVFVAETQSLDKRACMKWRPKFRYVFDAVHSGCNVI